MAINRMRLFLCRYSIRLGNDTYVVGTILFYMQYSTGYKICQCSTLINPRLFSVCKISKQEGGEAIDLAYYKSKSSGYVLSLIVLLLLGQFLITTLLLLCFDPPMKGLHIQSVVSTLDLATVKYLASRR